MLPGSLTQAEAQEKPGGGRSSVADAQETSAGARARATEQEMTDDERFSMIISVLGATGGVTKVRDKRIPEDVPMSGLHARRAAARRPGASE